MEQNQGYRFCFFYLVQVQVRTFGELVCAILVLIAIYLKQRQGNESVYSAEDNVLHPILAVLQLKMEEKNILIHPFKKLEIFRHAFHIHTAILYSTFLLPVGTFKTAKICICPTTKETKIPRGQVNNKQNSLNQPDLIPTTNGAVYLNSFFFFFP